MIKNILSYFIFIFIFSAPSFSQSSSLLFNFGVGSSDININYKTGFSGIDKSYNSNFALSYYGGVEYKYNFNKKLSLGVAGGLSLRAASFNLDSIITANSVIPAKLISDDFLYVQLKVNPDYEFPLSQQFSADVFGGFYVGILLDANESISEVITTNTYLYRKSIKENLNTLDYGLFVGAGIRVTRFLYTKASYQEGLSNILNNRSGLNGLSSRNREIYLTLSIRNDF